MLKSFQEHQPVDRHDPKSPIYDDLEDKFPEITWRQFRSDGTFNPIFRRANPLAKLGLIDDVPGEIVLTPLAEDVLQGVETIEGIYQQAARIHLDDDGNRDMAEMCQAALQMPGHIFHLLEIEYSISGRDRSKDEGFPPDYAAIVKGSSPTSFGALDSTRKRRLSSFMQDLVYAGAFVKAEHGWRLGSAAAANAIVQISNEQALSPINYDAATKAEFREFDAHRAPPVFNGSMLRSADPTQTALALERANTEHHKTLGAFAEELSALGLRTYEHTTSFDLAVFENTPLLAEIKSINAKNCVSQFRKAIVQLLEYNWANSERFPRSPIMFIVCSRNPKTFCSPEYLDFIEGHLAMCVIWQERSFVDRHDRSLLEILNLQQKTNVPD